MTKEQFLSRCGNAYDMGLVSEDIIHHIERLYDGMTRLEGGQIDCFAEMLETERQRTSNFSNYMQLANDKLGYDGTQLLAILTHHCQQCGEDPKAWHTRPAFCSHKKSS